MFSVYMTREPREIRMEPILKGEKENYILSLLLLLFALGNRTSTNSSPLLTG